MKLKTYGAQVKDFAHSNGRRCGRRYFSQLLRVKSKGFWGNYYMKKIVARILLEEFLNPDISYVTNRLVKECRGHSVTEIIGCLEYLQTKSLNELLEIIGDHHGETTRRNENTKLH